MKGIDISSWQRGMPAAALNSVDFAILKIGEGLSWADPAFDEFYAAASIPLGAYVYSHAGSADAARQEAQNALYLLRGRPLPLGIYIDIEEPSQLALGALTLTQVIRAFCDTVKAAGYVAGIYGSSGVLWSTVNPSQFSDCIIWVASWGARPGFGDLWQSSATGRLPGYSGDVDFDADLSERFTALVDGSAPQPSPQPAPAREHEYADYIYDVRENLLAMGNYGPQVESMQILLTARGFDCGGIDGIFGEHTLAALKSFQSSVGVDADGLWGGLSFDAMWNYEKR